MAKTYIGTQHSVGFDDKKRSIEALHVYAR